MKQRIIIFCTITVGMVCLAVGGVLWMTNSSYGMSVSDVNSHISYANVEYELEETGENYQTVLGVGHYKVGVHIPEGNYQIALLSGSCRLVLRDEKNKIFLDSRVRTDEEAETEGSISNKDMEDIRLYNGMLVTIYHNSEYHLGQTVQLEFQTENAQMPLSNKENPNTESYSCSESFIVGEDILAGSYDIVCLSGSGYLCVSKIKDEIWENEIQNGNVQQGMKLWKEMAEESLKSLRQYWMSTEEGNVIFQNVVFAEKNFVELPEGMKIQLFPSAVIESEDYENFY